MLAPDPVMVEVDGELVELLPTLKAALRLTRKHSLPAVLRGVAEGSVTMIGDVLVEATGDHRLVDRLARDLDVNGMQRVRAFQVPVMEYLRQLVASHEPPTKTNSQTNTPAASAPPAPMISREQFYCELFEFASGSLGWPASTVWNTPPAEIMAARVGREKLLTSIFGTGNSGKGDKPRPQGTLAQQANAAMAALGARKVKPNGEAV